MSQAAGWILFFIAIVSTIACYVYLCLGVAKVFKHEDRALRYVVISTIWAFVSFVSCMILIAMLQDGVIK